MTRTSKTLLILGAILVLAGPFLGFLMTVISMMFAFHDLGDNGIANPNQLSAHIGSTIICTLVGLVFAGVGIVLLIVGGCMVAFHKPPPHAN
jgi:biopolymer transport protein ExbB/TolQ